MSSLRTMLNNANLIIGSGAFTWGKSFWQSDKSYSQYLSSTYDSVELDNGLITPGTKVSSPSTEISEYYNGIYSSFLKLDDEYAHFKKWSLPLSDHLVFNITEDGGDSSITLTTSPSTVFPLILMHKYFDYYTIYHEKYSGSSRSAFTFDRNTTTISNINPSLTYSVTETITSPQITNFENLEIQLSCYPVVPGSITINSNPIDSNYQVDYFFGIIRSGVNFDPEVDDSLEIAYETGVGTIYLPSYIDKLVFTHPISLDDVSVNESLCIKAE